MRMLSFAFSTLFLSFFKAQVINLEIDKRGEIVVKFITLEIPL